jgi:[protein-PII] uridylyltransferase
MGFIIAGAGKVVICFCHPGCAWWKYKQNMRLLMQNVQQAMDASFNSKRLEDIVRQKGKDHLPPTLVGGRGPPLIKVLKSMESEQIQYKFGMDYSRLAPLPEDPLDRLPYFNSFKALISAEKDKIRAWHQNGAGGREVIQVHTGLMDEVIKYLVDSLVALEKYADASPLKELTVIAVGGYGRGELNPCSDIDLLFLRPKNIKRSTDNFIQDLTSVLWGIGLDIGQSVRTVQECLSLAKQDLTIKTSMIETRFLTGNKESYEKFSKSIQKNILGKNVRAFLNSKVKEKYARHGSGDGVVSNPEPDIKDGPGGLRDYHTAL